VLAKSSAWVMRNRRLRAKPYKIIVDIQAASPSS
jgi:hypothetical protein